MAKKRYSKETGRPYVHSICGYTTVVADDDFTHLCNPLRECNGTFCVHCEDFDTLDEFYWEDTEETLLDYRERRLQKIPEDKRKEFYESYEKKEGRVYIHNRCSGGTLIQDIDFYNLCDPFTITSSTFCANCKEFDTIDQFRWEDTNEAISDYRRRLYENTSLSTKLWFSILSPLVGVLMGVGIAYLFGSIGSLSIVITLAVVCSLGMYFIGGAVCYAVASDTKFYTQK